MGVDAGLAEVFAGLAKTLAEQEQAIVDELIAVQGSPTAIGGYYQPDPSLAAAVMRPSKTFNEALATPRLTESERGVHRAATLGWVTGGLKQ